MRALFITGKIPYPLNTGVNQRVYHLLRGAARVSEVTLVCFLERQEEFHYRNHFLKFCREVCFLPQEASGFGRVQRQARPMLWARSVFEHLHPTVPAQLRWYDSPISRQFVDRLCAEEFDLVWAERLSSMALLPPHLSCRVLVDLDDIEHRKLAYRLRRPTWDRLIAFRDLEFLKLRRLEQNLLKLPYDFVVCSDVDWQFFNGSRRVSVVPNGVDLPPAPAHSHPSVNGFIFLFVGTMSYPPNIDAATFFAKSILPLIRRQVPDGRFLIVGRDPTFEVQRLRSMPGVTVTGTVPSVESYLSQATVVVAPIRFGGGTRIKILEAMAHRRAVVSTTVGAEGIKGESGRHFILADDAPAFADACLLLLRDTALRERIEIEAYSRVLEQYTWNRIEKEVERLVRANTLRN